MAPPERPLDEDEELPDVPEVSEVPVEVELLADVVLVSSAVNTPDQVLDQEGGLIIALKVVSS